MKERVIVDLDAGTDDAVALLFLLTQESKTKYEVVGITCTHGNTTVDYVCRNLAITLQSINRTDIPVFRGAEGPLISSDNSESTTLRYFHGKDGFGDKITHCPESNVNPENAVSALNRLSEGGISLVCLGPLTNIALALRTYPGFSKNVREIYIMGGCLSGEGNATPTTEFNFYVDPEAAHIVLSTLTCPITLFPWESCLAEILTSKERFNVDDSLPHMRLLNTIERDQYKEYQNWCPCDAFLMTTFLNENFVKTYRTVHLKIDLQSRGTVIVDQQKKPNARVVQEVDARIFKKIFTEMASFVPRVL